MMREKLFNQAMPSASILLMGVAAALMGCSDSNYDLGNLDKTIAIGSEEGFALPGNNSVSEIQMADMFDLENNDIVSVDPDGSYYILRGVGEEDIDSADVFVDEVELTQIVGETEYDYNIGGFEDEARALSPARAASGSTAREIYHFEFNSLDSVADVLNMTVAGLRSGMHIDFQFSDELKAQIANLRSISINLPDYFDLTFTSDVPNDNSIAFDPTRNVLTIANPRRDGVQLYMRLNGLRFTDGQPDEDGYSAFFSPDSVNFIGGVILDVDYLDSEAETARGKAPTVSDNLVIHSSTHMEEKVILTQSTGYFNPAIKLGDDIGSFEIHDLPDFLDDEEVHLNLENPELRVWVNSNMDIRGIIEEARIKAYDAAGREVIVGIDTDKSRLFIDPHTGREKTTEGDSLLSTKTAIIISDKPKTGALEPHTYYAVAKEGSKLADLFYNIPRKVSFDVEVAADTTYEGTIRLGYKNVETKEPWYYVQPSFEIYSPLAFNSGSVIVYKDSIKDWHKDLKDTRLSKGATITLTADIYNTIPMDLKLHATPIELIGEEQWKDMDERDINVTITDAVGNDVRIKAGEEGTPSVTPVKIVLTQSDAESFQRIDGVTYAATAIASDEEAQQGVVLNSRTQKLRIDNIGVILRGKLIIDLND